MPKYIPGSPEILVQNMPGAGSLIAANHVYNVAKPDGLSLVMTHYNFYMDQLVERKEVQFDARKFGWIGSPVGETVVMYMRSDAPYKTIHDMVKAKEPAKCGSSVTASGDYMLSKLLEDSIGAKIQPCLGYPGGSEIDIAVEKGEVVCRAHNISAHFGREPFDTWHKKISTGTSCRPAASATRAYLTCPPLTTCLSSTRRPTSPPCRASSTRGRRLRQADAGDPRHPRRAHKDSCAAYDKALKDPELLQEAEKGKMDVNPSSGEELEEIIKKVMDQPKEVTARVRNVNN